MLRMTLLGVGTAVPDQDRENTHMVWEASDGLLLVDAGVSTYQRLLRANLDPLKLRGIFLTHSHADHINVLAAVLVHFSPKWTMSVAEAIEEIRAGGFAGHAEIGREFGTYTL